jgi:hypothetical protein
MAALVSMAFRCNTVGLVRTHYESPITLSLEKDDLSTTLPRRYLPFHISPRNLLPLPTRDIHLIPILILSLGRLQLRNSLGTGPDMRVVGRRIFMRGKVVVFHPVAAAACSVGGIVVWLVWYTVDKATVAVRVAIGLVYLAHKEKSLV